MMDQSNQYRFDPEKDVGEKMRRKIEKVNSSSANHRAQGIERLNLTQKQFQPSRDNLD